LYLYGASGSCKVIIDLIKESNQFEVEGVFDDNKIEEILDIPVLSTGKNIPVQINK